MKNILKLTLFGIMLFSCNRDAGKENNIHKKETLLGKWTFWKSEMDSSKTRKTNSYEVDDCVKKSIYEFTSLELISTIFEEENGKCTQTDIVNRKYTFDETKMLFWYENEVDYPYHIIKLTDNELVIEDRTQDRDGDGKTDTLRRYFIRKK